VKKSSMLDGGVILPLPCRGRLEGANLYATLGAGGYRARAGDHGFALLASGLVAGSGARADAGPLWDLP